MSSIDCVFSKQANISGFVFVSFPSFVGVIHAKLTPLFHKDEVCGAVLQKTISSRLVNSVMPIYTENQFNEKFIIINAEQINSLSEREGSVLFLSLLNYSVPEIANALSISKGTIKTYITRICNKLHIPNSLTYIQNNLEKRVILNNLPLPDIKFKPISILTIGDDEQFLFLTKPNMSNLS